MQVVGPNSNGITHVNKTSDRREHAQCSLDTRAKERPTLLLQSLKKCFASCFHIQTQNDRVHFCLAPGFLRNPIPGYCSPAFIPGQTDSGLRFGWVHFFVLCWVEGILSLYALWAWKSECAKGGMYGECPRVEGSAELAPLQASCDGSHFLPLALNLSFRTFWVMAVCTEVFAEHRCPRRRARSRIPSGHRPSPRHLHLGTKQKQNRSITAPLWLGSESRPAGPLCLPWSTPRGRPSLSPQAPAPQREGSPGSCPPAPAASPLPSPPPPPHLPLTSGAAAAGRAGGAARPEPARLRRGAGGSARRARPGGGSGRAVRGCGRSAAGS